MATPTKGTELLDLVRKSGLLEQPKIDGYVTSLQQEGVVEEDATRLASRMVKDGLITVFQARQMLRGRYRGFFLGKYKVLEPIGSGGMADVYLCEHNAMKHKVAIKILPIEKLKDPSLLGRFKREAQAIASLNHPNVVRAFDLDNEGNLHYLVTEYVDGCNLQDFIKKNGPMEPERAANYIAQAAAGLQHIQEAGLVHRDIKPGNLLLDRSGIVKLLDLGLARFNDIERQDNLTRDFDDGRVLGTADYIAPEQGIKGSDVDIKADIYSLGATFYFLLKGEAPFEGATVTQKLLFHQIKEPPPLPDHVPADLVETIKLMMAKKAADRIQSPGEVIDRLIPYITEPVPPVEEEMPPRSSALGAQPKSTGPKSSSRLSGRMAMTGLSHPPLSSSGSGRVGPRSGIDPALRSTPHAGVNIPTTPNHAMAPSIPELVDDDEEMQQINPLVQDDQEEELVQPFIRRYRWLILGVAAAVLLACALLVYQIIHSTLDQGPPLKTGGYTKIPTVVAPGKETSGSEPDPSKGNPKDKEGKKEPGDSNKKP
ncbi:MAG: protein kinase [Gemmatales bacterium]